MKSNTHTILWAATLCIAGAVFAQGAAPSDFIPPLGDGVAAPQSAVKEAPPAAPVAPGSQEEMLLKMRVAVERIAEDYGNPKFAQIFTNDPARATALRERVAAIASLDRLKREVAAMEKKQRELAEAVRAQEDRLSAMQRDAAAKESVLRQAAEVLSGLQAQTKETK
ncbi:hypothetical protein [Oleiharenicola sp. Vm1]|uniref:hypothetical protein n=1 Tax=Oleiharenicola sp. Vm1 TaxID=3398393 RepID=UPI0039F5D712